MPDPVLYTPAGELAYWLVNGHNDTKPGVSQAAHRIAAIQDEDWEVNEQGDPPAPPTLPWVAADHFPAGYHDLIVIIGTVGPWSERELSNSLPGVGECLFDVFVRSAPRGGNVQAALLRAEEWAINARKTIMLAENWAPVPRVDYHMVKTTDIIHTRIEPLLERIVMFFRVSVERRPWTEGLNMNHETLRTKAVAAADNTFICRDCGWESEGAVISLPDPCTHCGKETLVRVETLRAWTDKPDTATDVAVAPKRPRKSRKKA